MEKVQQYLLRRFSYLTAALILLVGVLVVAEPADAATPLVLGTATTISSGGQFSTPTNTCAVLVSALGGAGAAGFNGSGPVVAMTGGSGGAGGYLTTLLPLGASQILTVQVGTGGSAATSGGGGAGSPGGGSGYYDSVSQVGGGGGGGESSVTLGSTTEVIASGGGGGASTYQLGPWAGGAGAVGGAGNGSQGAIYVGTAAGGGSQSGGGGGAQAVANGSSGVSNQGGSAGGGPGEAGGGGGAGYFGGGGGGSAGGGGGGSNYVITGALASNGLTFTPPSQSNGEVVLTAEECQSISVGAGPTSPVVGGNYTPLPSATSALPIAEAIDSTTSSNCSIAAGVVSFNAVGSCQVDETQVGS